MREGNYPLSELPYYFIHGSDWWLENHTLADREGNVISELGDEFGYTSDDIYYDPAFATYVISAGEYDPSAAGIAVDSVNFPDETFRAYVSGNIDKDSNGYLSASETASTTKIDVQGRWETPGNITSLKGIEFFTELQILYCGYNQLTDLSLCDLSSLAYLFCNHNQLKSLDCNSCPDLLCLRCEDNQLRELNIQNCTQLETLNCSENQLSILDIRNNPNLAHFSCESNYLRTLDISQNDTLLELVRDVQPTISSEKGRILYFSGFLFSDALSCDVTVSLFITDPDFVLPAGLTTIGEEAFAGGAFTYAVLPEQAVSIGRHAFADCPNLVCIYIPEATTDIHQEAFGNMESLIVIGKIGSEAQTYAAAHSFGFAVG